MFSLLLKQKFLHKAVIISFTKNTRETYQSIKITMKKIILITIKIAINLRKIDS